MKTLRRTINIQTKVLDATNGLVEYVASNQVIDSDLEIIYARGWRFDRFSKNSPLVDSHKYDSIEFKLGEVVDWRVDGDALVETAKWLTDVPEHRLATIGWKMTLAGMPPACSVGFMPEIAVGYADGLAWQDACRAVNQDPARTIARRIFMQQQQQELSMCIIGANPSALAKSYKAGALDDADLETLSTMFAKRDTADATDDPADVASARQRAQTAFLMDLTKIIKSI